MKGKKEREEDWVEKFYTRQLICHVYRIDGGNEKDEMIFFTRKFFFLRLEQ